MCNVTPRLLASERAAPALETIVDTYGLTVVVEALAIVCAEKGEHLRSVWTDPLNASLWDRIGRALNRMTRFPLPS